VSVLAAQVSVGMWSKNGLCMKSMLDNYWTEPCSRVMRDLDIVALQVGTAWLNPNALAQFLCFCAPISHGLRGSNYTLYLGR
jgi:hypothetical protein